MSSIMSINDLFPRSPDDKFLNVPYNERWEHLKPIIVKLYMGKYEPNGKPMTMGKVAVFMRDHYSFHAAETQYRYHLSKWGVRRRTHGAEKEEITAALGRRTHSSMSTSDVTLDPDKAVDKKQMKRYLKDQIRHHKAEVGLPGVLSSWNLPYAAYSKGLGKTSGQPSPFGGTAATPTYLSIQSPEAATPGHAAAGPSPTMQLIRQKAARDKANLFLQGRHFDLLASCGKEDRITVTSYLHDFYMHSFVVAKYWGRGPRIDQWTPGLVAALTLSSFDDASPSSLASAMSPGVAPGGPDWLNGPTQLCRWSIHVRSVGYDPIPEKDIDAPDNLAHPSASFEESMQKSITNNTFSLTPPDSIPISTELISQSLQEDPELLRVDAWKVAIMAGNVDLLYSLFDKAGIPHKIDEIYPLHLAATFLDGGNTCCSMVAALSAILGYDHLFFNGRDDLGHTVLDKLMITVLRSHTSVRPELASARFNPPHRFPGEEKDVCGRWDADSPAVRALFRHGYARIPTSWKHAFCHTAAQAVCHSVIATMASPASPRIDSLSGLFVRRCTNCGLELKMGPLHALVVVTFYLAHRGMPGETLFGSLAILVCLLSLGASASLKAAMSVGDILGSPEISGRCCHKPIDAYDLMQEVPHELVAKWSTDCQTGWACIQQVLLLAKDDGDRNSRQDSGGEHESATVNEAATIQVELLTYRRIHTLDPWTSDNFSMASLKTWLEGDSLEFGTPLVENNMMRNHSPCGWFYDNYDNDFLCPVAEDVCKDHFMNMDVYNRATFLNRPGLAQSWLEIVPPDDPLAME
ncbi:uncharacterized protein C8A04DRAFT_38633 [Dichotomopilus funicola]|uniref:Clr5 domain-containing protein n=1 Tax=Dichotomopilus funicola TaxID=1934379 RepID=A0AAN6UZN0_9PEZI|nr:hypothetical protein C8A04DRAFT_38633 [Dichotomopilus funicola]